MEPKPTAVQCLSGELLMELPDLRENENALFDPIDPNGAGAKRKVAGVSLQLLARLQPFGTGL
jgi:hypothetical protein